MPNSDKSSGKPSTMLTSEHYDTIRRAKKARQRVNHSADKGVRATTDIMSDIKQDRQHQREERRQAVAQHKEDELLTRIAQAFRAADNKKIKELQPGSLASKVANGVLYHFPTVIVTSTKKRYQLAYEETLKELDEQERVRTKAIWLGRSVAFTALNQAYQQ